MTLIEPANTSARYAHPYYNMDTPSHHEIAEEQRELEYGHPAAVTLLLSIILVFKIYFSFCNFLVYSAKIVQSEKTSVNRCFQVL